VVQTGALGAMNGSGGMNYGVPNRFGGPNGSAGAMNGSGGMNYGVPSGFVGPNGNGGGINYIGPGGNVGPGYVGPGGHVGSNGGGVNYGGTPNGGGVNYGGTPNGGGVNYGGTGGVGANFGGPGGVGAGTGGGVTLEIMMAIIQATRAQSRTQGDPTGMLCYNCGQYCHSSNECSNPKNLALVTQVLTAQGRTELSIGDAGVDGARA
jgi:hypothetical protein